MPVHRAREGIVTLLFIAVALCTAPRAALAAVVEVSLRAELLAGLPSFEVVAGEGTVDAPRAAATVRPLPGWVVAQAGDFAGPGSGSFEFFEIGDLTTPLTATGEDGSGRAQATLQTGQLAATGTARFEGQSSGPTYYLNATASRHFEVTLHGEGTLLVSIPFRLSGSVTGQPTTDEIFASTSVGMSATRSRLLSFDTVDELYFSSAATLYPHENPPNHPDVQFDVLTLAVNFIEGDTLMMSLSTSMFLGANLQPVPLPASGPLLIAGLIALMRRRRCRSLPQAQRALRHRIRGQ